MSDSAVTQPTTLTPEDWINCVLHDEDDRICINTREERPRNDQRNICQIVASVSHARLSDYLVKDKCDDLPPLDLNEIIMDHEQVEGVCKCSFLLFQDAEGVGNISDELEDITEAFGQLDIDLGLLAPIEQFILLCRAGLCLPPFNRYGFHLVPPRLLVALFRETWQQGEMLLDGETWLEVETLSNSESWSENEDKVADRKEATKQTWAKMLSWSLAPIMKKYSSS